VIYVGMLLLWLHGRQRLIQGRLINGWRVGQFRF
jgi:hypothetical protein